MGAILTAIARGVRSQLQPRMLALLIVPFIVAIVFWALSAWGLWDPVTGWFQSTMFEGEGWIARFYRWISPYGLSGLKRWIPDVFAFLLIVPLAIATALGLIAVLSMPAVIRYLGRGEYKDVQPRGSLAIGASISNMLRALGIFIVGYPLTIPLWFIPPLAFVVPLLWWGWLTSRLMRFDSAVEHATAQERQQLVDENRGAYLLLGVAAASLNYVPPLFIIAPVLSALVFAHFSLIRLRAMRALAQSPGDVPAATVVEPLAPPRSPRPLAQQPQFPTREL